MKRKSCNLFSCTCGCQRVFNTIYDLRCHETWINKKEDEAAEKSKRLRITMNVRKLISSQIVGQLHYIQFIEGNINYGSKPKSCWIFICGLSLQRRLTFFALICNSNFDKDFHPISTTMQMMALFQILYLGSKQPQSWIIRYGKVCF